jgi:hypothetical protein
MLALGYTLSAFQKFKKANHLLREIQRLRCEPFPISGTHSARASHGHEQTPGVHAQPRVRCSSTLACQISKVSEHGWIECPRGSY